MKIQTGCHAVGLIVFAVTLFLLSGCDDLMGEKADERRRAEELRQEQERDEREKRELAAGLANVVEEKTRLLEADLKAKESEMAALSADAETLAGAIKSVSEEKTSAGQEKKYEVKVLHMMKDPTVGELAIKYLGADFTGVVADFKERVRAVRSDEARYTKALQDADAAHAANDDSIAKWADMTREQKDAEVARLRRELSNLEMSRNAARKEMEKLTRFKMVGNNSRQVLELGDKKEAIRTTLSDLDSKVAIKLHQLDSLTNPNRGVTLESYAVYRAQDAQRMANHTHNSRLIDIERNMKPSKTLIDTVTEYEAMTIGRLRAEIAGRIATLGATVSELKGRISTLKEMRLSISVADLGDLRRIRTKLLSL